ncbi:9962_t:CDS:2 [Cetraspora pellucida]|uniref:9962_t:CDS:1 n=1 Tax=Cetraspora pellucida TaxID=1433469 RepID=A0ACA9L367_9GLOM|nr:9962_t:CDS:2 [Cetraspora pellucida]
MKSILETTKQVLMQNILIIEKQKALEGMITQLANNIKTLQSIYENFKSNMEDRGHEWWQKEAIQGIKNAIDNWLYSNDKIYEQAIRQEFETLCPDRIGWYRRDVKWDAFSESDIIAWKESREVQWCLKNLDSMIEEEDKTYL